ncbi:MAG TPA: VWA domain-containing protein [Thermoanaerobaculia bacterium]|nr:VWA domain-containing protein [Thermoanaerobaculia bacterium]
MLSTYFRTASLAFAAALCLAPALVAQSAQTDQEQQPQGQFEEKVDVQEVLLDVLVTDRQGNVIVGLDKNDFQVLEDGKPVELTGVTFYSNRRLVQASDELTKRGVTADQVPEDRYFVLFFVDSPLMSQQLDAGRRAREWVHTGLLPNDWVAVVSYDSKLKVHEDFTRDRKALDQGIADAVQGKDDDGNWPSRIKEGTGPSLRAGLPRGEDLRDKTVSVYDAVRLVADATGSITGRKNLLLFTGGFPARTNTFGQYLPDQRRYPGMSRALNDSNVAVYPIDLNPTGTENMLSDFMNQIANDTGGRYFYNFTNFTTPLEQIASENSGYYLLSYRSEKPVGATGFQEVRVKTNNPEFRIRARKGYDYGS